MTKSKMQAVIFLRNHFTMYIIIYILLSDNINGCAKSNKLWLIDSKKEQYKIMQKMMNQNVSNI